MALIPNPFRLIFNLARSFCQRPHQGVCVKIRFAYLLLPLLLWAKATYAADIGVNYFTGSKSPIHLDRAELREIFFLRRTNWPDGIPIHIFVMPDQDPLHIRFTKEVLGVFPYQLRSAWDRMIFSGIGVPPSVVYSVEEMRTRVEETPGAIGYLPQ